MSRHAVPLAAALTAGAVLAVVAQQPPPPAAPPPQAPATEEARPAQQPQRPTFRSEANYIRVDAFVTRDGMPLENLTAEDFEVLEDGVAQRIDAFEHVRVEPAGPQAARIEPDSQQVANQMATDARARIFVVFLDIHHVPVEGSRALKNALAAMLSQMLGPDDFIGIITSQHSPSDLILARKTALIEEQLEKYWYWGRRDSLRLDPDEELYQGCYERYVGGEELIDEMIDRRREKLALDSLADLVIHLRGLREERKAVLTISAGWRLFRENPGLARALILKGDPTATPMVPQPPYPGIGPGGRPMMSNDPSLGGTQARCEQHRQELANLDGWQQFQDLMQDANRANVSFYPIDPRGLVVFDSPIGPRRPLPPSADSQMLRIRQTNLRTMADATDGLAVMNTSDLTSGLRRISADLTSYYLMGYYSSHSALDGKYHRITVRVKRPGVQVRARKGYRSATADEVARGTAASAAAAAPSGAAPDAAIASALGRLSLIRPDAALYLQATRAPGGPLWVAGEIPAAAAHAGAWAGGGRVSIIAVDATGNTLGVVRREIKAGERDFITPVRLDDPAAREVRIQVRAEPAGAQPIGVEVAATNGEPLLLRGTGPGQFHAAADFRFFRTEVLGYRWALGEGEAGGKGRVLDRAGGQLELAATPSEETADGQRWLSGTLTLAPLANGDYLLELTKKSAEGAEVRTLVPFRVLR